MEGEEEFEKIKKYVHSLRSGPLYFQCTGQKYRDNSLNKRIQRSRSQSKSAERESINEPVREGILDQNEFDLRNKFYNLRNKQEQNLLKQRVRNNNKDFNEEYGIAMDRKRLIRKAFNELKYDLEDNKRIAQVYQERRIKRLVLKKLKNITTKLRRQRRVNRQAKQIYKIFQLRLLFKAWKRCQPSIKLQNKPLKYCVKYTDYCTCEQCEYIKERRANIVPQREDELLDTDESKIQWQRKGASQSYKVLPLSEIYKESSNKILHTLGTQQTRSTLAPSTMRQTNSNDKSSNQDFKTLNNNSTFRSNDYIRVETE